MGAFQKSEGDVCVASRPSGACRAHFTIKCFGESGCHQRFPLCLDQGADDFTVDVWCLE
jgi:hypothetical protein